MSSSRVPPWAYTVVVVGCGLGTLGALHFLGVFGKPPAVAPEAPEPEVRNPPAPPSPIDPATLPPHRAAARSAHLAALLPVFEANTPDERGRAAGRRALEAYALYRAHAHPPDTLGDYVHGLLFAARNAGCADPLVRYAEWRVATDLGLAEAQPEQVVRAAEELGRTKYPAALRMRAYLDAALVCPDVYSVPRAERWELAKRLTEDFWSAFAEVASNQDPAVEAELLEVARELVGRDDTLGGDRHANHQLARKALEAANAREYVRLSLDGLSAARDGLARLGGNPALAAPSARTAARPDLERAATALAKAWELNPQAPAAPTELIAVTFELGRGAEETALWVRRAVAADPDNPRAWLSELATLDPGRGGTVDAVIAFARRCRETGNWGGGVPQVAAVALDVVCRHRPDFLATPDGWGEAAALFDAWLAAHPGSREARSLYARTAVAAERYEVAHQQFEALSGRPWSKVYPDLWVYAAAVDLSRRSTGRIGPGIPRAIVPTAGERVLGDQTRRAAARAARRDWFARTYREAFTRLHAATDPGHAEGLAALSAAADAEAAHFPLGRAADAAWSALDKAVAARCADPLVRVLHDRFGQTTGEAPEDKARDRFRRAVGDLLASKYPDAVKLPAAFDFALAARGAEFGKRLTEVCALFARCVGDPDPVAREEALRVAAALIDVGNLPGLSRTEVHTRLKAALAEAKADPYPGLVLDGVERTAAAWESLGPFGAFGATGAAARSAAFRSTLREAELLLGRAWRLVPERPEAPTRMLTVGTGLGYPRAEIDRWFARAVDADPDNYAAIRQLTQYLEPIWHGARNGFDLLAIRPLTHTAGRWEGAFGLLAYEAESLLRYEYMGARPDDPGIWGEVEFPLLTWLKATPDCRYAKTVYALAAVRAGQFATADRLFGELRGKPWPGVFPSPEVYREAVEVARRATGRPKPKID